MNTALDTMLRMTDEAVDRMKTSAEPLPVILVGGGSILTTRDLPSASEIIRPRARSRGERDRCSDRARSAARSTGVFSLEGRSRDDALAEAKKEATNKAVAAGAISSTVDIVDVEEVPLAYLPSSATRIRVKAVGDLALPGSRS